MGETLFFSDQCFTTTMCVVASPFTFNDPALFGGTYLASRFHVCIEKLYVYIMHEYSIYIYIMYTHTYL